MSDRPFKVLGIQQIAVGGLDKSRLRTLWVERLSGSFVSQTNLSEIPYTNLPVSN